MRIVLYVLDWKVFDFRITRLKAFDRQTWKEALRDSEEAAS